MTSKSSLQVSEKETDLAETLNSSTLLMEQRQDLERVLELFRQRDLWKELERVLKAEQLSHLRGAAFSSSNEEATYHKHVAQWLEHVLNGALENYADQARARLSPNELEDATPPVSLMENDSGAEYLTE